MKVDGQAALQVGHFQSPCVDRCASMFTSVERSNVWPQGAVTGSVIMLCVTGQINSGFISWVFP